jgi:hypothetical protein
MRGQIIRGRLPRFIHRLCFLQCKQSMQWGYFKRQVRFERVFYFSPIFIHIIPCENRRKEYYNWNIIIFFVFDCITQASTDKNIRKITQGNDLVFD